MCAGGGERLCVHTCECVVCERECTSVREEWRWLVRVRKVSGILRPPWNVYDGKKWLVALVKLMRRKDLSSITSDLLSFAPFLLRLSSFQYVQVLHVEA